MIKITLHSNCCLIEPQGPLAKHDFDAIARQVDPVIEDGGRLDGLIIKTRSFPGWLEGRAGTTTALQSLKNRRAHCERGVLAGFSW